MRALITGAGGFAGGHLIDYLLNQTDWQLTGCVWPQLAGSRFNPRVNCIELDLRDRVAVSAMLDRVAPDVIFHLAGQAFIPASWDDPWDTLENNIRSQANLLDALVKLGAKPRILVVGSNEEYGLVRPENLPLNENSPLRTNNPYGVSKLAQDWLGFAYFLSYQIPIVRVRPFNHIGPRQSDKFVISAFAKQIAAIATGRQQHVIRVGNLTVRRDFTDVRDMVRAYHFGIIKGQPGEVYNIGTGRSSSLLDILNFLIGQAGVSVQVEQDPALLRPSDAPEIRCDPAKFCHATGWQPAISLEQSLRDILDDWRTQISPNV